MTAAILASTLRVRMLRLARHEPTDESVLAEVEFALPNMVCEGCAAKIASALTALPGVREVRPKVPQKHVTVRYEPAKVGEEALRDAVGKAGFTAVAA